MTSPAGWTTLGQICAAGGSIQTGPFGSQLHASDYVATGTPVVMPTNIGENRVEEAGIARVATEHVERLARHKVRAGDIVYSRRGDITKRALIRGQQAGWLCGTGCLLVRPGESADPTWLSYWLGSPLVHDWLIARAVGATMPNLNTEILSALTVLLPSLDEQRRIAGVLGALDDLIEVNRRLMSDMEELLAAQFASFGFDTPGDARLDDLITVNPARPKPKGDAPYVDMAALSETQAGIDRVMTRAASGGARFMNGDTLMARITPCLENGKIGFVDCLHHGAVGVGSTEFIVLRSEGDIPLPWTYLLARSPRFRDHVVRHMTGTSGRQRCPADAVTGYRIAQPTLADLRAFDRTSGPLFAAMKDLREENRELASTRSELLPLLMSGRVRVGDVAA